MNSNFLIFECIFSIRIFSHIFNTRIISTINYAASSYFVTMEKIWKHFTLNESQDKAICKQLWSMTAILVYIESKSTVYIVRRQTFWICRWWRNILLKCLLKSASVNIESTLKKVLLSNHFLLKIILISNR